ncbi:protein-disulfide reductase DsbD domain-containing protein [Sphingomonas jeddahensis]|uniref:Thiol:disulfide interchange protein DsbD N-terminal domain-containing protein n=1 Tax=Sphingomonas jeddahensis TaxID=1915074 RepID=A0A1V2ET08_9SPHN|nr:protein-disulfide reductase DsbD domain-containing protein [Sphingomonas jeddahensis]ONF95730.1 hypothetical protein SPHI_21680 [Sphingomonas jeddahensis]
MIFRLLFALFVAGAALAPAAAQAPAAHIATDLSARVSDPRPGMRTRIGITMTSQPGWHAYWRNPGDSGLPPAVTWTLPEGVKIGALEYPAPTLLTLGGLASYVHEGRFTLLADLSVDDTVRPGTRLPIRGALTWLACSDSLCVPERANIAVDLVAGRGRSAGMDAALLRKAEAALPRPATGTASVTRTGDRWEFLIDTAIALGRDTARLYPVGDGWFGADAAQRVRMSGSHLLPSVPASGSAPADRFEGVLSDGRSSITVKASLRTVAVFSPATGLRALSHSYDRRELLRDLRFRSDAGEIDAPLNGNGAGKLLLSRTSTCGSLAVARQRRCSP